MYTWQFGVPVAVNALVSINLTIVAPCLARLGSLRWAIVSEQLNHSVNHSMHGENNGL